MPREGDQKVIFACLVYYDSELKKIFDVQRYVLNQESSTFFRRTRDRQVCSQGVCESAPAVQENVSLQTLTAGEAQCERLFANQYAAIAGSETALDPTNRRSDTLPANCSSCSEKFT
ncbi:hypothetical protein TNCV_1503301 [Trichonephila clavipes]|uniref:Uncharacterized protein n=1 Tax=Trichonephila clavipes TaxID=2585209 RepID=A0A8X6RTF8_TRICX|nr:hypothetical protein TNCV_1503301 [Trichonephila clavipes]